MKQLPLAGFYSLVLLGLLWLVGSSALAQQLPDQKQLEPGNQQWFTYSLALAGATRFSSLAEASYRTRAWLSEPAQYLFRANGYYRVKGGLMLGTGLVYTSFYRDGERSRSEWRPHQELSLKQNLGKLVLNNRLQLEERFLQTLNPTPGTNARRFNLRVRYRLQLGIPLLRALEEQAPPPLQLLVGNEIMLNAGRQVVSNVFDQNRLTLGPSWQVNKKVNLSVIYLNQFMATSRAGVYRQEHIIRLDLRHTIL